VKDLPTILFRCDASSQIGFGHVVRCIALGEEFRRQGCHVSFAMKEGPTGMEMVKSHGFPVYNSPLIGSSDEYREWMCEIYDALKPDSLILDVRDDLPRSILKSFKNKGMLVVTIDDPSDRRLDADLAFYPPVPQVHKADWEEFSGELYSGWEWIILRPEFSLPDSIPSHSPPVVLVTMGGSDPAGFTLKSVAALDALDEEFDTIIVLGPGFVHGKALQKILKGARRRYEIRKSVVDMPALLAQVDVAVVAFGMTAYEVAAMGIYAMYLCLTEDHVESASTLEAAGFGTNLGLGHAVKEWVIGQRVACLLLDQTMRSSVFDKAREVFRSKGINNIVQTVIERHRVIDEQHHRMANA